MRILLALTCCVGLASFTQAAQQQQDENNPKAKKKGGSVQSQQVAVPKATPKGTPKGHVNTNPQLQTHHNLSNNPQLQTHHKVSKAPLSTLPAIQSNTPGSHTQHHVQHFNLANKPNPNIPNVKFQANNRIHGAQNWKGQKYAAFRNYSAQWHDRDWWKDHHHNILFISGGWYFWDGGYWYPAWGYAPDAYYAFDGPIYAGSEEMDPGQVVANVQAALQEQGFYHGEVDGILGPQTRAALAEYQSANSMEPTGAIDEPTLESLNMA